jgi:uncharacterized protein (TIGR03437 family)
MTEMWIDRMPSARRPGRATLFLAAMICALQAGPASAQLSSSAYRVLGQPDLRQNGANIVQGIGMNAPLGTAIDVRGGQAHLYIADTENSRVLAWQDVRSYQMGDPPAIILGQPGPQYSIPLGTGATGLYEPVGLAAAPGTGDLYVADYSNNRVVRFPSPFDNPQRVEPDAVFGEPNFTSRTATAASASSLNHPRAVAFDSDGNLWVVDAGNNRVVRFAASSLSSPTPPPADTVIGQKDFQGSSANGGGVVSGLGFDTPSGLAFDSRNNLYVSDFRNARVLKFTAPLPTGTANPAAAAVWGQSSLTAHVVLPQGSATTMAGPAGLSVDSGGNIIVAVPGENRVLVFPPDGQAAKTVIGQTDFTTTSANTGAFPLASAASLSAPADVKFDDAGNLFIPDSANNRLLQFAASAKSATRVWGQPGFRSNGLNQVKPGSLFFPFKVAVDYSAAPFPVYVSDANNNRVLVWKDAARFRNGDPADLVIGQPDLFSNAPNVDSASQKPSSVSLRAPTALAVGPVDGALFVADSGNNRVLRYPKPVNQSGRITPDAVIGQPDFTSASTAVVGPSTLNKPFGLAVAPSGALFVADSGNNRVLEFASGAGTGASAIRVFGQPGMNSSQKPTQASAQTLTAPQGIAVDQASNLYVADTGANRILIFPNTDTAPAAGAVASFVLGQLGFTGATASTLRSPADVSTDSSGNIYIADTGSNRVLTFPSILFLPVSGGNPSGVIGQPDLKSGNPNWDSTDGLAAPDSLYAPVGVWVDRQDTVYIADSANNRVLHFLKPAVVVNAATLQANSSVARGSLATLFGAGLTSDPSASVVDSSWPRAALNRQVIVNYGSSSPLWYIGSGQVNFQVPSDAPLGSQAIALQTADTGELIAGASFLVAAAAPGIFTTAASGAGQAAAVNQDGTLNGPSNPAPAGSTITLYGTGQGQVSPPVADGAPAPTGTLSNTVAVPTTDGKTCLSTQSMCVAVGSGFGQVTYSGLAPGFVGLWQINVTVPRGLPAGATPIRVLINGAPANLVTITIR